MRTRQGHTLIECMVAIVLLGATLATVSVAISGVYRCRQRVGEESATELDLQRFAAQLRADAHRAVSVKKEKPDDSGEAVNTLLLTLTDGRSVEYTVEGRYVERVLRQGDRSRHRETYRLAKAFAAHWQVQRDRPSPLVSLMLDPATGGANGPLGIQTIRIDAAVGLLRSPIAPHES